VPQSKSANDVILHLVAVDSGNGPVLLYWTDLSIDNKNASVRGRLIFSNGYSSDFSISQQGGKAYTWALTKGASYWYGDYQTASAFTHITGDSIAQRQLVTNFFPVWVQPDNTIRYTNVSFSQPLIQMSHASGRLIGGLPVKVIGKGDWKLRPMFRSVSRIPRSPQEVEEIEKYGVHAKDQHR
jgi:hypothetical protein